jgi:hypothetical protein
MKKIFITLGLIAFASLLLSRCEKSNDYYARQGATELKDCPITQIVGDLNGSPDTLIFTYTAWGDPESVIELPTHAWLPKYVFKYDKKRRLTDLIGLYSNGQSGNVWQKYFYDNPGKGNITRDSVYVDFQVRNGVITCHHSYVIFCIYDKYDRVIRDSSIFLSYPATIQTYDYDAVGNIAGRTYDNKINLHRTNKIWMFYDRDYSVNNPFVAESYIKAGLPSRLNLTYKDPSMRFFMHEFRVAKIEYDCR